MLKPTFTSKVSLTALDTVKTPSASTDDLGNLFPLWLWALRRMNVPGPGQDLIIVQPGHTREHAAFVGEIVPYDPATRPENAHFIYHSMPCEGCLGDCILPPEDGMFPCVSRLDDNKVLARAREILTASIGQA